MSKTPRTNEVRRLHDDLGGAISIPLMLIAEMLERIATALEGKK